MKKIFSSILLIMISISTLAETKVVFLGGWQENKAYGWNKTTRNNDGYQQYGVQDIMKDVVEASAYMNTYSDSVEDGIYEQAEDINKSFIDANLKNDPKIFIGHSQGGLKAFAYMKKYGADDVKAIFSVGTPWKGADIVANYPQIITYKNSIDSEYKGLQAKVKTLKDGRFIQILGNLFNFKIPNLPAMDSDDMANGYSNLVSGTNPDIKKDSAQSMNPNGEFILNDVQNIERKVIYKLIFPAPYAANQTPRILRYVQETQKEGETFEKDVVVGAIVGTHSNIWDGPLANDKAELEEPLKQLRDGVSTCNKWLKWTIGATHRRLKSVKSAAQSVQNLIEYDRVQDRTAAWFGSAEHDGLIAVHSQEISKNLTSNWIERKPEFSNLRMDVYHVGPDEKSEKRNDGVRSQLNKWIKLAMDKN